MNKWKISEAKARLSEVIECGCREPQIIVNRDKPVAVLVNIDDFRKFEEFQRELRKPSIKELLVEIRKISDHESDLELSPRQDRLVPVLEEE